MSVQRKCSWCKSVDHTSFYCRLKRRKPIQVKKGINKNGKLTKQWLITRETWFARHPAVYYTCYLQISPYCPKTMLKKHTTLDHIKSRSRHPELRFVMSNLAPCCYACNKLKGSKDLEQIEQLKEG